MIAGRLQSIWDELPPATRLVAVSKFHPADAVQQAYAAGQRVFGESRPQELSAKAALLGGRFPGGEHGPCREAQWHFIGHLQTNKLKMVLPYVTLVESVDSVHLLEAVARWATERSRTVDILLELHVAAEETKQGFSEEELFALLRSGLPSGVRLRGLMAMATNTPEQAVVDADFARVKGIYDRVRQAFPAYATVDTLSMGMSADWRIALRHGATLVRIGTAIFGERV